MRISAEEIKDNWIDLVEVINNNFSGERLQKIEALHDHFKDRMMLAPASGRAYYHNAFPGGYVAHILNIMDWAHKYYELFKSQGMYVDDISRESVTFAAMFHDLGKIGNLDEDYYVTNTDEWRAKKLQEYYNHNPAIHYMTVTDRSIWILNQFNIDESNVIYSDNNFILETEFKKHYPNSKMNVLPHYWQLWRFLDCQTDLILPKDLLQTKNVIRDKHFLSYNRSAHPHRCAAGLEMFKYQLNKKGMVL